MSVALGYIHSEFVTSEFVDSLLEVHNEMTEIISIRCTTIANGRNNVVERFMQGKADWLWFVDTDTSFGLDTLGKFKLWNKTPGILAGECFRNTPTGPLSTYDRILGTGMANTMIHRDVFTAVREMYPQDPWHWFAHDLIKGVRYGEDYTFCNRAVNCGYGITYVPEAFANHYKLAAVRPPGVL